MESCSGPEAADSLAFAAFGDHGTREFFTHVRFHKHEGEDGPIVIHMLVELYARSAEEATEVLSGASRGSLTITSLAEESRPPASSSDPRTEPLPTLRPMVRAVLRFVASVLIVSGVLMIGDAGATLLWQEPVSYLLADRQQGQLEEALANPKQRKRVIARMPLPGDSIGKISLPTLDRSFYIVEGTDLGDLRKGPGHYADTPLPGDRGTVAIAGHRTTYGAPFRKIDDLDPGDPIRIDMPYGRFTYRVEKTSIVEPTDLSVKKKVSFDRLVLTACHPLYSASQRIVVFARLESRGGRSTVR